MSCKVLIEIRFDIHCVHEEDLIYSYLLSQIQAQPLHPGLGLSYFCSQPSGSQHQVPQEIQLMAHCNLIWVRSNKRSGSTTLVPQLARIAHHLQRMPIEYLGRLVNRETRDLGVEENDKNPADEADGGIEAKCARRGKRVHLCKEGGRDDDCCLLAQAQFKASVGNTNHLTPSKSTSATLCPYRALLD